MREIKFRIWNGREMEYRIVAGQLGVFYVEGLDPNDSASMSNMNTKYADTIPVMQFTGLLDKNGKEIYEGDVVAWDKANHQFKDVVTYKKDASFRLDNFFMSSFDEVNDAFGEGIGMLYVIGNIYENPELTV